jgi:Ser/Thr protein kinase RdoA (MazF antagonist)
VTGYALAEVALARWGGADGVPRLIKERENIVYEVHLRDGTRAALRLHRPGYQTRGAIEAELVWMSRLAASGLAVPVPVPTDDGALTATAGDRIVSVVTWVGGLPIGSAEQRLGGDAPAQESLMERLGALIGRLHNATDALKLPATLERPRWDAEGHLGEQPLWGRFWENPAFAADERALIGRARERARDDLGRLVRAGSDFGLIHADFLRENVLDDGLSLKLIDFDDSGWGFRSYDLATAVYQSLEEPALPQIVRGLMRGYGKVRPGSDAPLHLVLFVMLRSFASAGWITTRAAPGDPRQKFRTERAVRMAMYYIAGSAPWDQGRA